MSAREQWRPQLVSSKSGGGPVLDDFLAALGLEGRDAARLGLRLAGQRVQVAVEYTRADDARRRRVPEAVVLSVRFEGPRAPTRELEASPPSIVLRREEAQDRRDKARGLTREVQTGFPGFDHAVFIDHDASDEDARRILSKEATRQAVLRLLDDGHFAVRLSPTEVSVRHPLDGPVANAARLLDALEDLLFVARAGGPTAPAPGRRGETLFAVAVALCTAMVAWAVLAWSAWTTSLLVAGIGVVVGAAVALFARPAIEDACAGDSASARRSAAVLTLFAAAAAALTFAGLVHLNGALDRSEGEEWVGVVVDTGRLRTERSMRDRSLWRTIAVRWRDGTTDRVRWRWDVEQGDRYSERRHPGALGFEWVELEEVTARR